MQEAFNDCDFMFILDRPPAREHLSKSGEALQSLTEQPAQQWADVALDKLEQGHARCRGLRNLSRQRLEHGQQRGGERPPRLAAQPLKPLHQAGSPTGIDQTHPCQQRCSSLEYRKVARLLAPCWHSPSTLSGLETFRPGSKAVEAPTTGTEPSALSDPREKHYPSALRLREAT
jgi:hypothetical protein